MTREGIELRRKGQKLKKSLCEERLVPVSPSLCVFRPHFPRSSLVPLPSRQATGAPAHMTITVYPELVEAKGVALMRGDVVSEKIVNAQEVRPS